MYTIACALLVSLVLLLACDSSVRAQDHRHGAWFGARVGYGSGSFSCDTCRSPRLGGWADVLAVGATLSPHLQLGAEWRQWFHGLSAAKLPVIGTAMILLSYYPRIWGGPFVEGGAGLSYYALGKGTGDPIEPLSRDTTYASGSGWGFTVGGGWEVPIGGGAIRARLAYSRGTLGTIHSPNGALVATGWQQSLLSLEVGFNVHP